MQEIKPRLKNDKSVLSTRTKSQTSGVRRRLLPRRRRRRSRILHKNNWIGLNILVS